MEMHFIYFPADRAVTLLNDCGLLFPDFSLRRRRRRRAFYAILGASIVANSQPLGNPRENTRTRVPACENVS